MQVKSSLDNPDTAVATQTLVVSTAMGLSALSAVLVTW